MLKSQNRTVPFGLPAIFAFLCFVLGAECERQLSAQTKPNILYIFVDDLSSGMVGFTNSNTPIKTPNIDALARGGLQFTQAYANAVCSPSRGSLYTGFHLGHTVNDRNVINFRSEDIMPGEMVKEAGYATATYGKWGYGSSAGQQFVTDETGAQVSDANGNRIREGVESLRENPILQNQDTLPTMHGYDDFLGYLNHVQAHRFFIDPLWQSDPTSPTTVSYFVTGNNAGDNVTNTFEGYTDDFHTYRAMDFISDSVAATTPFMIQMHFNSPHPAYDPGEKLTTDFAGNVRDWDIDYQGLGLTIKQRQLGAMITRLDEHVGALVDHLRDPNRDGDEADSVLENTVIMFTSDNGGEPTDDITTAQWNELGGNHIYGNALRGGKRDLFEGGVRVPMFAYWLGTIAPNRSTSEIIDLADFMPTLADLAGIDAPIGLDGISYAPLLTGEGVFRRRPYHVWEHHEGDGPDPDSRMAEWSVLKDNFKLIHFTNGSEELYDLNTDPSESQTLDLNAFADLRAEFQAIAVAEGVTQASNAYRAEHVNWAGGDQDSTTSSGNWSNYDPLQEIWVSVIANNQSSESAIAFADAEFLGVEVTGASAKQTIRVNPLSEMIVRNELRISENGRVNLDAGTLNCWRWLDVKPGGELTGSGDLAGQFYNDGSVAPGLPTDLPVPVVPDGGDDSGNGGNTDGNISTGITFFDPTTGNGTEPTENVIFDGISGGSIGTLIDSSANPGARGQNFVIGQSGTTVEIGGVTLQSNGSQSFSNGDEMTIVIFSGNNFTGINQQIVSPAGLATAPGISILHQETFQLPASVPDDNFLIIGFANSVTVNGGEDLGMMVFSNTAFDQLEGTNNGGGRLLYRPGSAIDPSPSRDMRFSILGSAATTGDSQLSSNLVSGQPVALNETGLLSLDGDFFHQLGGELRMQVADVTDADQLVINGTLTNGGALVVEMLPDYQPQDGDQIILVQSDEIIGDFSNVTIQDAPDGFDAEVTIDNGNVVLTLTNAFLAGDFDRDGDVDADDIDFYNGNLGQPGSFNAELDLDNNDTITLIDHDIHVTTLAQTSNGETGAHIGDVNLDGTVDVLADALALIVNLGGAGPIGYAGGDLNADGIVDVLGDAIRLIGGLGLSNAQ